MAASATALHTLRSSPSAMGPAASRDGYSTTLSLGFAAPLRVAPRQSAPDVVDASARHAAAAACRESAGDDDVLVPSIFTWAYGGQDVCVTGAWDEWATRTPMYKNGAEFIALIYVPCGQYQFKYYVDDNWQCAPHLPTCTDAHGNTNNIVNIVMDEPEFDSSAPLDENAPPSPRSSYDQAAAPECSSDPPALPPQLEARSLKPLPDDISPSVFHGSAPHDGSPGHSSRRRRERPFFSHVCIDHLYKAKGQSGEDDVHVLSQTTRVGSKVINTIFITNRSRTDGSLSEADGLVERAPS